MLAATSGAAFGAGEHVMVHFVDEAPCEAVHSACGDPMCLRRTAPSAALQAWPARALAAA
jgi:hypothetical protein